MDGKKKSIKKERVRVTGDAWKTQEYAWREKDAGYLRMRPSGSLSSLCLTAGDYTLAFFSFSFICPNAYLHFSRPTITRNTISFSWTSVQAPLSTVCCTHESLSKGKWAWDLGEMLHFAVKTDKVKKQFDICHQSIGLYRQMIDR